MKEWMESDPGENLGPSQGCLLSLAFLCFFWAGVLLLVAWRWGWL